MKRFTLLQLLTTCLIWACSCAAEAAATKVNGTTVIELGTRKQLLFDELFFAESRGIKLRVNTPCQEPQPVLVPDKPWEGKGCYGNTVMFENARFRMWYDGYIKSSEGRPRRVLCYAESTDGTHWEKPNLGLIEFDASKNNNIVAPESPNASVAGAVVFRDDRAAASERYKLWTKYFASEEDNKKGITTGLWAMVSPDGLRWKMIDKGYPLRRGNAADSQNICFWDSNIGKYVGFVRMKKLRTKQRQRDCSIGLMTSDDFRNWTYAKEVFHADERIPVPEGNLDLPPFVDLYTPGGMKVPGVPNAYILLPTMYYHWREDRFPSTIDVGFATSRDMVNWWRPPREEHEPFLRLGLDGSARAGMLFANPWPIAVNNEIWFYYGAGGSDHRSSISRETKTGIYRARLRRDGFVCAEAGYEAGEFTTPVVTFGGGRLELNMDGSAGGWLQVEIQSADGEPISGYRLGECDTTRGNSLQKLVTWQGRTDVSELIDKPVKLRFVMRSMRLFAFQFVKHFETEALLNKED